MSGSRIKTAGRFKPCVHMGCFDLETFVQLNQRSRKWQCPICLKNNSLEDITIDPYFNRITKMVQDCGEDVTEIDVKPDGSWRVKNGCQFNFLEQWHLPDGSICGSTLGIGLNLEASKHLKEEGIVGHINPKQLSKPRDTQTSSRNQLGEYFENCSPTIITMSSSSSQSHRDDEDCSINQDGIGNFDIAANNDHEVNAISLGGMDVIVLSDSEEENANLTTTETLCITRAVDNGGHSFPAPPAIVNACPEDPVLHAGASSLRLFNSNDNDFEMSLQALGSGTQAGSQFQLFDSDNVSDTLIDSEFTPVSSSACVDGCTVPSKCTIDPGRQVFGSSMCHSNTKINDSLVINPLAFVCADPPVQTVPPTQSPGQTMQFDQGNDHLTSNGICGESLGGNSGVGNGAAGIHAKPATSNGLDLVNQLESNKDLLPPRVNDEVRSNGTTNRKRSYGPFSFPRQPRSARRPHLS